jgi:hydrogenase expression/formation protein HypE
MSHISLAHGNGGHFMRELIEAVFARELANPLLNAHADAASLPAMPGEIMMSVDGFTVQPLEFPGGDIGSLAIHGTVNDLAVSGALPKYLSLSAIIEEGMPLATLERLVQSMARAARESEVQVVCGDTKVVARGEGSGVYFTTTGIGLRHPQARLSMQAIEDGDCLLVSGPVGDHGTAVMLAREQFGLQGDVRSDAASVIPLCQALYDLPGVRFLRDPTRGGLATVLNEICQATGLGVTVTEQAIPVRDPVTAVCEMLGYDPLYLACEGRVVAVVAAEQADEALRRWQALDAGKAAAIIGNVGSKQQRVVLTTVLGGERILEELEDDPLPRIC